MATASTGWLCTHTASITSTTDTTATIKVTCYWKNNGWTYDILHVSAWVYCNGQSVQVKSDSSLTAQSSTSQSVSCGSATFTINKTTSAQSISCYAKITANSSYVSGTKSSTKTNISVAAKTSYTIKYNANGGSGAPSSQTKWYGTALTLSSTKPTRTGYTFQGWATSASGSVAYAAGARYTANASITLYAVWKALTYTVKYDANGGSGAPSNQTKTYGVTLTLSSTKPTRTNYTFKGWGTSASATTIAYAAGANYTANAGVTLYAIWEQSYTKPRITSFSVQRCDSNGTSNEEGTYSLVNFSWETDLSVSSISIEWKSSTETTWSSTAVSASGVSGSVSNIIGSGNLSGEQAYDIRVTVADSTDSSSAIRTLNGTSFLIDFLSGGKGTAIGKPAEVENTFDVGYDSRFRKSAHFDNHIYVANNYALWGVDPDGNNIEVFKPNNVNGNIVIGYGSYSNSKGNVNIYGDNVNIYSNKGIKFQTNNVYDSNGRNIFANKSLWASAWYMSGTQHIDLPDSITNQPNGIVLAFSEFVNNAAQPYGWSYFFVSKSHVTDHAGNGVCFPMFSNDASYFTIKYLFISDTKITGDERNNASPSTTACGIKNTPNHFVLRQVIGV